MAAELRLGFHCTGLTLLCVEALEVCGIWDNKTEQMRERRKKSR